MNIYLIGMMGSGKSVTARALAAKMKSVFVDLDEELEKKIGKTILQIFERDGELFFRDRESEILMQFAKLEGQVVATGGGIVLRPKNVEAMKQSGKIVYLQTSLEWLWERVKHNSSRPLLTSEDPKARLLSIFRERKSNYESSADYAVKTDGKTSEAVADEIFKMLKHEEHCC